MGEKGEGRRAEEGGLDEKGGRQKGLSPFYHRLILSQKCRPSGEKLGEFFNVSEANV